MKPLSEIVAENPYPDYADWWQMGGYFLQFMSDAIVSEWRALDNNNLGSVQTYAARYIDIVYHREAKADLAFIFEQKNFVQPFSSGEFDAVSYAFFRSAFESIEAAEGAYGLAVPQARRRFTQRVGAKFYARLHEHLGLNLPTGLESSHDFAQLQKEIERVGMFLSNEGYLRDHFAFTFDVRVAHARWQIEQTAGEFVGHLKHNHLGYALYEMGYPAILPSAVYLYHSMGEAQHHSSRTIEELFARVGYEARETDDFDPTGFPSDMVVELWEIRPRG